ncbi:MAG TPA: CNP1-like family protein [Burkholderiales bacterium]|nr:CNP1-like family protein [Burkholderiales bacterium]
MLGASAAAFAQPATDWERQQQERNWREREVVLPAYPANERLMPFYVSATNPFSFFVDRASVSVDKDGVVRYTLVARSPEGADTVTYEGMRCSTREFRIYATGSAGRWTLVDRPWRAILLPRVQPWEEALYGEYFCPLGDVIPDAATGIRALSKGTERGRPSGGNY